ncbi:MAG: hypothetical protein WCI74_04545 [Actinomycetes bacterium]
MAPAGDRPDFGVGIAETRQVDAGGSVRAEKAREVVPVANRGDPLPLST